MSHRITKCLRSVVAFVRYAACACVVGCSGQLTPAGAASIVVDASSTVAQSGGDDLATVKNIFQDANAPQDGSIDPLKPTISDIGVKRMRILRGDIYCDLDANGNFIPVHTGEWDLLTQEIDWAVQNGLSPHMAVGANLPESFVPYGAAETWSQAIVDRYKSYALQLVSYIVQRSLNGGATSVIFEVSNEMDIADYQPVGFDSSALNATPPQNPLQNASLLPLGPWGRFLWWIDSASYNFYEWPPVDGNSYPYGGDPRRVPRGIAPMQKIWADAIETVKAQYANNPDPSGRTIQIQIAGPASAGFTFLFAEDQVTHAPVATLDETFLDYMFDPQTALGQFNSSLDYISFHYYGDFLGQTGSYGQVGSPTMALKYITGRLSAKLAALGHPNTKFFISEWGPTTDMTSIINYSHLGAAWAAAFLTEAVADNVVMGSYLVMSDAVGTQTTGDPAIASLVGKINGVAYPKPATNVFKMFNMMTGTRNAVSLPTDRPNLGAFAASDASSAGLVIFNYNSTFTTTDETVDVELDNLAFNGVVTAERYLVDASTSNLWAYLQPGQPDPDPTLQQVEQFPAQVINGKLLLPSRTLGASGVTFWRIH
jgi:hypothetical protein